MFDLIADYEDLYENAPCGYLTLQGGRIVRANATFASWMECPVDHFTGKPFPEFLNIAGRIFYETHVGPLLQMQGSFTEVALDLVTKSGNRLPVFASAIERRDNSGRPLYTRIAIFKAAERRQYERDLIDNLKREKQSAELREQFVAVLGHDLRNPLAAIASGISLIERTGNKAEKEKRILSMMHQSVERMSELIDNVLDLARGRLGGGLSIHRTDCDIEPVLKQVVLELATVARPIETDFALNRLISCDASRIGQLLSNLIGNAITHGSPDHPIKVRAFTGAGTFELSVSNGGDPIPPAAMERLFQPFFRGAVRDSRQGLGLGLYIASEIAKAHGGTLDVSSSSAETRFAFSMPLNNPAENG